MISQNNITLLPQIEAITGNEKLENRQSPYGALVEFYHAFNHRNMDEMANNWAHDPNISMDNPLGGIMRGWENVQALYTRIFEGQAKVYVEYYDYTIHEQDDFFFAVGRERGHFEVRGKRIELAIRTSRIFHKINGEWKQVHHHGSIENPDLLKTYQNLVRQ